MMTREDVANNFAMESFFSTKIVQSIFVIVFEYVIISVSTATRNLNYLLSIVRKKLGKQVVRSCT